MFQNDVQQKVCHMLQRGGVQQLLLSFCDGPPQCIHLHLSLAASLSRRRGKEHSCAVTLMLAFCAHTRNQWNYSTRLPVKKQNTFVPRHKITLSSGPALLVKIQSITTDSQSRWHGGPVLTELTLPHNIVTQGKPVVQNRLFVMNTVLCIYYWFLLNTPRLKRSWQHKLFWCNSNCNVTVTVLFEGKPIAVQISCLSTTRWVSLMKAISGFNDL